MSVTGRTGSLLTVAALLLGVSAHAADDDLARVDALVKGGATQLALRVLEASQPAQSDMEAWVKWEQRRFEILVTDDNLAGMVERIGKLPQDFPPAQLRKLLDTAAEVALEHGDGATARIYLNRLLVKYGDDKNAVPEWRERIIRSYLAEDNVADAGIAMELYRKEFNPRSRDWQYLYARVLLRTGDYKAAAKLMATQRTFEGRLLELAADLRGDKESVKRVLREGRQLAADTRKHDDLNPSVWSVLAEAGAISDDKVLRAQALEQALPVDDPLFKVKADDLWDAYVAVAEGLGNKANLLVGDDDAWYKLAARFKDNAPYKTRAVYALIALRSQSGEHSARAHYKLLTSLYDARLGVTAQRLYTASDRYANLADVPPVVRYYLSDKAFHAFDIKLSASMVEGLDQPPPGQSEEEWALRRARLSVYAGDYARGIDITGQVLERAGKLDDETADRIIQIPFDLQAAGRNGEAYALFERIHQQAATKKIQRETLFWMADARSAQGRPEEAAELYLRSAVYKQPDGSDIWGQTARFNAGEALSKAGLVKDAERVYRALLKITEDPKRRAVIDRNLKHLWLLGPKVTTP